MAISAKKTSNRAGLLMVGATLLVICLIVLVLFQYLQTSRTEQVRQQGSSLIRTLAGLGYDSLVPGTGSTGLLRTIFESQNDPAFAYAAVNDPQSHPVVESAAPGIVVPPLQADMIRSSWMSERELVDSRGRKLIEFYTPLYADKRIVGYLRTGYLRPGFGLEREQVPFIATLALFVFLLVPIFYLVLRREVRPLGEASARISEAMSETMSRKLEVSATGELGSFMERFNTFVGFAQKRIAELEGQQEKLQTSKQLISYSKARVDNVLESIPEAILILDPMGKISYANRKLEALLGVPVKEVLSQPPEHWCKDPDLLNFFNHYSQDGSKRFLDDTIKLQPASMSDRSLALKAYPLFSPSDTNSLYGTLVVLRDVTKEALAQQAQAEFISHVAHELKTPLNTLGLYSESLLGEQANDPAFRVDAANVIHDEVDRLSGLIGNLLTITRIEQGDMTIDRQRVRIADLIKDAMQSVARSDNARNLNITADLANDITSFSGDKNLLRVAINNLLTNAIKYSDAGASIKVTLEDTGSGIRMSVTDSGIGIAPEEQGLIFNRFFRSESDAARKRTGHGLGLSLVSDIVHLHAGVLSLQSTVGVGSTFTMDLPKDSAALRQAV